MKLTVPRSEFLSALSKVQSVIDKKGIRPLLTYVIIEAEKDITLKATNLQAYYRLTLKGNIEESGVIAIPGKKVYDIIKESKAENITITTQNNMVFFDDKSTNYSFYFVDFEDFPELVLPKDLTPVEIDGVAFQKAIKCTTITMGDSDQFPHLAGLFIEKVPDENKVRFMSSDNHSLSLYEADLPNLYKILPDKAIMIPRPSVQEIGKLEVTQEPWKVVLNEEGLFIRPSPNTMLFLKLRNEKFVDYSPLYSVKIEYRSSIKKDKFQESLKRMCAFLEGYVKDMELTFTQKGGGSLLVKAQTNAGKAEEELEVSYKGEDLRVHLNPKEVLQVIQVMDSEEIEMSFTAGGQACIITGKADPDFICVLMPLVEEA